MGSDPMRASYPASAREPSASDRAPGPHRRRRAQPLDGLGPSPCSASVRLTGPTDQPFARGIRSASRSTSASGAINSLLDHRPRPARGPLRRQRCRQERPARHDGALYRRGCDRRRPDRRARPRSEGIRRAHPRPRGPARAVVVATPADHPPLMRLHGAWLATAIAEYFRDRAPDVLLIMDSLTRFAQAQREIALAIGEAPATKGYPPSVFARLPQLVERAGNGVAGPAPSPPSTPFSPKATIRTIRSRCRAAILDGHIVLSRRIAESGHYPAIDVEASISRAMHEIAPARISRSARQFRQTSRPIEQHRDLIAIGAYQRGSDPRVDQALALWPRMQRFLQQDMRERVDLATSLAALNETLSEPTK